MTDSFTRQPICVSTDGDAGPYIMVQLDQLDLVKKVLDHAGQPYSVEEDAISVDGAPMTVIIDLGPHADVERIKRGLDQEEDPRMNRSGRRRNVDHR
jgi:hypothetical protein